MLADESFRAVKFYAMTTRTLTTLAILLASCAATAAAQAGKPGDTYRSPSGATLKLLLDDSNVGPEVSVGELTFPPNADSGEHTHGAIEMFYVLSGEPGARREREELPARPGHDRLRAPARQDPAQDRSRGRKGRRDLGARR